MGSDTMMLCVCGCLGHIKENRRFISGHNLKHLPRSDKHRKRISDGQRIAWETKRKRKPIGSKNKDHHGYIRVKTVRGSGKWEKEHILVVETLLGRKLIAPEVVHHINGKRDDNNIDNLYLCKSPSEHLAIETSMKCIVRELLEEGAVRFNKIMGRYERIL